MSTYIFILGKDPDLSLAELRARYGVSGPVGQMTSFVRQSLKGPLDQREFDTLGGQVKAAKEITNASKEDLVWVLADYLEGQNKKGKLNYGVSVYGWPERNLRPLLLGIKKELKKRGVSSRFANQNFKNLSSAQHKGLKGGIEIVVCRESNEFLIGEVIAVQDIDSYSKRDYKKPFRDMKVGMLPPKLAQIMINLAGAKGRIWDPFCGGGVLIMEGLLMGHDMLGSDISEKNLDGARQNVDWLKKTFKITSDCELFVQDAASGLGHRKCDAIVFEGYLGPPQQRMKKKSELIETVDELTDLYTQFFESIQSFRGPVVAALPFFKTREGDLHLEKAIKSIEKMGFKNELNLKYARETQLVGRDIFKLSVS